MTDESTYCKLVSLGAAASAKTALFHAHGLLSAIGDSRARDLAEAMRLAALVEDSLRAEAQD